MAEKSQAPKPLRPAYKRYTHQACFVAHSHNTDWREDLIHACEEVLPKFGLQPWYADKHFDPTRPLRSKVVEAIANGRYGIYDISNWQDREGRWQHPRNVYIELGMAVALNRPALILRHTSNQPCPLPACLNGLKILEFSGETTLKRALEEHLPLWTTVPPDRDWFNRFCIFGERVCDFREEHPRARQLGEKVMHCHVSDGFDTGKLAALAPEREEVRAAIEEILGRYADLKLHHLGDLQLAEGYQFLLCSHCQAARSSQFAVYKIIPTTPPEVFIAIGMSIAIETLFEYDIPKVLLVRGEQDLPSLLRGYEVVEVAGSVELKRKLSAFIPSVIRKVRETTWRPRPLPFIELVPTVISERVTDTEPVKARFEPLVQIPAHSPFFVGRAASMLNALNLLAEDSAHIAIVGPGGIGKTALATEIAWAAFDSKLFPDGIVWRNFSDSSAVIDVLKNWLGALGGDATDASLRELSRRWRELIDQKEILVVLDGAEDDYHRELALLTSPSSSVLLTTRNESFRKRKDFSVFNLDSLSQAEIAEFLRQATANLAVNLSEKAVAELASDSGGNPASLLLIVRQLEQSKDGTYPPFKVGQKVVYPNHGVGTIEAIEKKQIGSTVLPFYLLRLAANNSPVLVPLPNAAEVGLRNLISSGECKRLLKELEADFIEPSPDWKDRFKTYSEWMRSGDIFEVAKVLKGLTYVSNLKPLSFREQRMLERAKYLIISEVAVVTRQRENSVETLIDKALWKALPRPGRRSQ